MSSPIRGERQIPLDITTARSEGAGDIPALTAYAFTSGGALIDAQPIDEKGNTRLSLPLSGDGDALRIVLGPPIEKEELDVAEVLRRGGIDAHVALRPNVEQLPPLHFELTPERIRPWLGRRCVVKGTLLKRTISGGLSQELPVCNAAVDIWEVDPWPRIIVRLPDFELERLRDILDGPWPPIRWPIPPRLPEERFPGLFPDLLAPVGLNPQPLPPRVALRSRVATSAQAATLTLPADLQIAIRTSRRALERALIANIDLVRPILCWLYPQRVRRTKIATVFTDECGHFRTVIWRSILDTDIPDLYFTARQRVWPGFWVTIYEPQPVACHTWWNYQCGTEVTLITRHPAARTCLPCPPVIAPRFWVLFKAIGNTSVWGIHGANTTTAVGTAGHDATKLGLLNDTAPWGGTLRPRIEFDNLLRSSLGVRYYRVSYKRPTEPETAWRASEAAIGRHYDQTIGGVPVSAIYSLGPSTVGTNAHLYEIPPALPPVGQWSTGDLVQEFQSAVLDSTSVSPGAGYDGAGVPLGSDEGGLWQIRVELFDTAGVQVDPEALAIAWRVPSVTDLSGIIDTASAADLGLVDVVRNSMILTVRVDNNPCHASIAAPTLDGNPASSVCGVMNYTSLSSTVVTPFVALQRNRFADYSFYVQRGEGPGAELSVSDVAATTPAGMPAPPSSTVGNLLDGCAIAGFTEQLYVAHRATDGWNRQSQYDASRVRAFVLAPVTAVAPIAVP